MRQWKYPEGTAINPHAYGVQNRAKIEAVLNDQTRADRSVSRKKFAPYRSSWESQYAERLNNLKLTGIIQDWRYEPRKFELAKRCTYTPDFIVTMPDGSLEAHEVKGFMRAAAAAKLRLFRERYPEYRLFVVRKIGGDWAMEERK